MALDLVDLMGLYAKRGIADWHNAHDELKKRAKECLGSAGIADKEQEATATINTIYNTKNGDQLKFIPMPKHNHSGIDRCFFIPVREFGAGGQEIANFELFLLVTRKECLGFRFEAAHSSPSPHDYGHVQMSRKMLRRTIEVTGIPSWLPVSYPAFPIATSDPVRMFLAMATAVHGYSGGLTAVLMNIFQTASRVGDSAEYLSELKKMQA